MKQITIFFIFCFFSAAGIHAALWSIVDATEPSAVYDAQYISADRQHIINTAAATGNIKPLTQLLKETKKEKSSQNDRAAVYWYTAGCEKYIQGKTRSARKYYKTAMKVSPENPLFVYYYAKTFPAPITEYRRILSNNSTTEALWAGLVYLQVENGLLADACATLHAAQKHFHHAEHTIQTEIQKIAAISENTPIVSSEIGSVLISREINYMQLTVYLSKILGDTIAAPIDNTAPDQLLQYYEHLGIINEQNRGFIRPNAKVYREILALALLQSFLHITGSPPDTIDYSAIEAGIPDCYTTHYAYTAVLFSIERNLLPRKTDGSFGMAHRVTGYAAYIAFQELRRLIQ